ncbi:MAG: glycosyltransferase [Candidatus Hydrogenedentes bacterium]|nr:glycosyltransferase [Candidatus Hydrogenedentota bacterium]
MSNPVLSVIVPAYNEEKYLPRTLASIQEAAKRLGEPVEIIVADNLSTDSTAALATRLGARVVTVETRCISAVRNGGAAAAQGGILVFCDADNQLSPGALLEIKRVMDSGRFVGGGMGNVWMERLSLGTFLFNMLPLWISGLVLRVAMVVFFARAEHFRAMGGFDETVPIAEDYEFGKRLKREGRKHGLTYKNLFRGHVVVSTRKYDEFGDFFILRHPIKLLRACFKDQAVLDEFWYKPKR